MERSVWEPIYSHILHLEREGLVTRTFRRLDPERQQAILDAILEEALEKGPTALNIKQVAQRAGVSVGSLYTYFDHRDGLLDFAIALCVRYTVDTFESFRPYLAELPLRDALASYLIGGVGWSQTQVGLIQFFLRAAYQGDPALAERVVRPIADTLRDMVQEILAQAVSRGEIRAGVDLQATTRLIHALMIAVGDGQLLPYLNTYFQVVDKGISSERVLEALLDLIIEGIGSESA
jgi:AcrR family transcriptional regulator